MSQRQKNPAAAHGLRGVAVQSNVETDENAKAKARMAKSLHYLAAEFVNLVTTQEDETIDVLYAAQRLGVEKRRIYDITNALIGAGVLQKQGKSSYKWIAGPVSTTMGPDNSEMAHERTAIEEQIKEIDECITRLSSYLNDKYYGKSSVVLTTEEIVSSCQSSENQLVGQTILAISAPAGTDVYVTNHEKQRDNEIFLSSPDGEIRTYLLPSTNDTNQTHPPSIPNTPVGTQTPRMQQAPTAGLGTSTPTLDFSQAESSQMMGFSNDYALQDLYM